MEFTKYNQNDIYKGLQLLIIVPHKQVLVSIVISLNTIITYEALSLTWFDKMIQERSLCFKIVLWTNFTNEYKKVQRLKSIVV